MSLAIVIPYYKKKFFRYCLKSLAEQTSKNFKVYIGNDNSPEDPLSFVNEFSNQLDIQYHEFPNNLGSVSLVRHWERCLELIEEEEWVMILGDDDSLGASCVDEFYKMDKNRGEGEVNIIRYPTVVINKGGEEISTKYFHPAEENSINSLFRKLEGNTRSSLSEYIFRKSQLDKIGLKEFPLAWHTDDLAVLEFSGFGTIHSVKNATVFFRNSGLNITSSSLYNVKKNKASVLFYYFLLSRYSGFFNENQRNILINRLQAYYYNDKKDLKTFFRISRLLLKYSSMRSFISFLKNSFQKINH